VSPTAALESILITGVIEAKEERDVMICDIPNTFIQAYLPKREPPGDDRVMMKITGVLVDMLININPELYGPAVVLENRKKVLYIEVLKAVYSMLEAALWYKTFRKDVEDIGFVFNPYDPCVANKKVQGLQQTIVFHVDDLKSSHKLKSVNDKFEKWLNSMYGKHGKATATRGQIHDYLRMELDY
jgi:hypothetical protein